ncbi:ATP-binding protein [Desulfocurvus vexinensis]|uniref:ATP-binding protein n=1 Tax=Desulfocurvus vexinensis TaxID=399548 RepID=UPI000490641F|nr:ATP-binding protein [Desulfocurvus vexinensis]
MTEISPVLARMLDCRESERIEFKEAKRGFEKNQLFKYCVALANEGGGHLVLGVTDRLPRQIVGTRAFGDLDELRNAIYNALRFEVQVREEFDPQGRRVLVLSIPGRPAGSARSYESGFWCRRGGSLAGMGSERLRAIFSETDGDHSAQICAEAGLDDLDPQAIQRFRELWAGGDSGAEVASWPVEQLLENAELLAEGRVTNAALVLLGKSRSLSRLLPDAEVIFEYRSSEASIDHQQRVAFREGLLLFMDRLWETVRLRVETHAFQVGLVRRDIPAFREEVFREGLLNAVCHRDYRRTESVFVRQYPQRIDIDSPGGLPRGLTVDNLMFKSSWRNRRIAEALEKTDLVERSGQGIDRMWRSSIRDGKLPPDYSRTDEEHVALSLHGAVVDEDLLRFLEQVGERDAAQFGASEMAALHYISRDVDVPSGFLEAATRLVRKGVVERVGKRFILSRKYYVMQGRPGAHTRRVGLDRETNLALVLKHVRACGDQGTTLAELQQVLPAQSPDYIQRLVRTLKSRGEVLVAGRTRAARWFAVRQEKDRGGA